jgi:hypothetical protein
MESKKQDERLKQRNFERSRLEIEQAAAATAKQVADDAEYQQWKRLIKTEKSGEAVDEDVTQLPDFQDVFIQYIVDNKVVVLEEVAGEFGIKTARAVAILEELVIDKKLMGVFDQRGLFLHISSTSLDRIAAQILAQGKLTMEQLHNIVNKEVDLIP